MAYERSVVTGRPKKEAMLHCHRAFEPVLALFVPGIPEQDALPPGTKVVQPFLGIDASPFELLFDEYGQYVGVRGAPYAERQGIFEAAPMGSSWGLLRILSLRRQAWRILIDTLQEETVHIVEDRRSRAQMAEDCRLKHNVDDTEISRLAQVPTEEFYRWRKDELVKGKNRINNDSDRHRRIVRVLCSPVWPPEVEWPLPNSGRSSGSHYSSL